MHVQGAIVPTAIVAGVLAAKRTSDLIPFCHPLPLDGCDIIVRLDISARAMLVEATTHVRAQTGVEMEAMVAASTAALTIYDMTKAAGKGISIVKVELLRKTGGKSGDWIRAEASWTE